MNMDITERGILAIIIGIIQGLAEFFPISSSMHLNLFKDLVNYGDDAIIISAHCGTMFALLVFFRSYIFQSINGFLDLIRGMIDFKHFFNISQIDIMFAATFPICIGAMFINRADYDLKTMAALNAIFAIVVFLVNRFCKSKEGSLSIFHAFVVGTFQVLSIFPGMSRLGMCMIAMRLMNYDLKTSIRYGLLFSIPAVFGSIIFSMSEFDYNDILSHIVCVLSAFAVGLFVMRFAINLLTYRYGMLLLTFYRVGLSLLMYGITCCS
ncbi:undecaprenyl-diphosphate phosphatase [Candidatus Gromoviella agglomerans]|uniref:undecaprenyl-diphosphate phosphatase n=1 Tax=Candidatus Gromoviella agglomerans TaxID=2806609 RepID=UPI001E6525C3|nr:undecaprenyl-diphosphate phosphatase [Candidatus Gromoviella agglomerans]UFX98621.1 Undecaprenyl pyrophosphate phosphatase [Candidatus Gromoviella agglomerans]